jgi:putative chitinase
MNWDILRKNFGKLSQSQVDGINAVLKASEGLPVRWRSYMLATAWHETKFTMRPVREAFWLTESWRRKNLRYYPYYGRGYVQLTWKRNYEKAGKALGVDLVNYPDKAMDPEIAAKILRLGMTEGWFTQYKLGNQSYRDMRKIINGTDRMTVIASYAVKFEEALGTETAKTPIPDTPPAKPKAAVGLIEILLSFIKALFK